MEDDRWFIIEVSYYGVIWSCSQLNCILSCKVCGLCNKFRYWIGQFILSCNKILTAVFMKGNLWSFHLKSYLQWFKSSQWLYFDKVCRFIRILLDSVVASQFVNKYKVFLLMIHLNYSLFKKEVQQVSIIPILSLPPSTTVQQTQTFQTRQYCTR